MKWFFDRCRRNRESLCLLASGLLEGLEKVRIENHLTTCADCRSYFNQIKMMTAPLTGWEKHFAHIETSSVVQLRLTKAIASADKSESTRRLAPGIVLLTCWQQLILPSRGIWAGLAAVWVLLLAANLSLRDRSPAGVMTSASPEMILSFQQQERLLAELMGPDEPRVSQPPKPFPPRPSSERRFEVFTT